MADRPAASAAMRAEADNWDVLADSMARTRQRFAELALDVVALPAPGPATDLAAAYTRMHDRLGGLFEEAVEEFERMARALRVSADRYEDDDHTGAIGK